MVRRRMRLAALTTLRLGGPAERLIEAHTEAELVAAVARATGARAGRRVERRDRRRGRSGDGAAGAHARDRARLARSSWSRPASRGTTSSRTASTKGCRGSSACPASPARPARRRSRTSAPTGRTSRRPSSGCACTTARPTASRRSAPPTAASGTARSRFKYRDRWTVLAVAFRLRESAVSGPLRYGEVSRALGERALAGGRARDGARPAARQGDGDRPRRPRLGQRGLVLHQPDPARGRSSRRCPAHRPRSRRPTVA